MLKHYKKQLKNIKDIKTFNQFFENVDYNQLSIKDINSLFNYTKKYYNYKIDKNIIIKAIESINSKKNNSINNITKYFYENDDVIMYLVYNLSYKDKKKIINYFIDKKEYSPFIMNIYFSSVKIYEDLVLPENFIDNFIKDLESCKNFLNYMLDDLLYEYIFYCVNDENSKNLLTNNLIRKIDDNNLSKYVSDNDIKDLFKHIEYMVKIEKAINSDNIDELFSIDFVTQVNNISEYTDFIFDYFDMLNKNYLPNSKNLKKFLDNFNNYVQEHYALSDYEGTMDYYIIKINSLINDNNDLDNFLKVLDNFSNINIIQENIHIIINDKDMLSHIKFTKLSILTLYLFKTSDFDIDIINKVIFSSTYSTYILLALINSQKMINNINNLDINDKYKYELLKVYKNIDKNVYKEILLKAQEKIIELKQFVDTVTI